MAKFRDFPQWTCQGRYCTQNFVWRATCRVCRRDVPKGLKKKQLEALVENGDMQGAEGVTWLAQRLRRPARLPRIEPVSPSRRPPSYAEVLDMLSECGKQEHSDSMVARNAGRWIRRVGTEVLGRYEPFVDVEKYSGSVTAPTKRQQQLLFRRGRSTAGRAKHATHRSLAQRACEGMPRPRVAESSATLCRNICSLR